MGNFYTDTIQRDPRFHSVVPVHDTKLLEPVFWAMVQGFTADAHVEGHVLAILETYRSRELQEHYFQTHKAQLQHVGVHHWGLAVDLVVILASGADWVQKDYDFFGSLAVKHELVWGRDWGEPKKRHSIVDSVHLQRITLADEAKLFSGAWYPSADYVPSEVG